ncbi:MAG TPA: sigma-70 family RNA polymerase sigma factor [Solirubrobacteraceae bacterium]|nr:sigma-70 family RNA polymerase sigma factor [Solirubrobacteraceae bacterium]
MRAGSEESARFTAVYEASYGAIHAYASRRVGPAAADEIAAETFLIAWRRMDALPADPLPWLYGVARNIVARHYRASGRRAATAAALTNERAGVQPGFPDSGDPALWEAWERMRPADREVLALIAWEELSVAEAAQVLGCPAPVFSVRLHRARRRLERLLAAGAVDSDSSRVLSEA